MRKWKEFEVPCKPKKEWEKWMCGGSSTVCCIQSCVGVAVCISVTCCSKCIYSPCNGTARREFYQECFPEKPKKLPQRDSKGRFCKKEETESYLWEGLKVPVDPKREWGSWMTSNEYCPLCEVEGKGKVCASVEYCKDCVYSQHNKDARRCFYEQYYGKWPALEKSKHPKLTVEIFNSPECPEWANWAAVDEDGRAAWYSERPEIARFSWCLKENTDRYEWIKTPSHISFRRYDSSEWMLSLIERPHREHLTLTQTAFHCPDCPKEATTLKVFPANHVVALDKDNKVLSVMELQCKEGEITRTSQCYYSPNRCTYYFKAKGDYYICHSLVDSLNQKEFFTRSLPEDVKEVRRVFPEKKELFGKSVFDITNPQRHFVICEVTDDGLTLVGTEGRIYVRKPYFVLYFKFTDGRTCCKFEEI